MKILFDARVLLNEKHTGIEEYSINLLNAFLNLQNEVEVSLFVNGFSSEKLKNKSKRCRVFAFDVPNKIFDIFTFFSLLKIDELVKYNFDLFFSPHFLSAPLNKSKKRALVVHDLSFFYYPEFFSLKQKIWHKINSIQREIKRSDLIFAVSQSTQGDILRFFPDAKNKTFLVYPGVANGFEPKDKDKYQKQFFKIRKKYNLPERFILYLGALEPRKNLITLVKAFEKIADKNNINLVFAGGFGWMFEDLKSYIEKSKIKEKIFFTGRVDQQDKVFLYNLAEIFIYPSFFEGFGLPVIEAMSCKIPVISSFTSSLPEVVGDAGMLVSPYDVFELANAMEILLEDKRLRDFYAQKGYQRSQNFKWERSAKRILDLIKDIL